LWTIVTEFQSVVSELKNQNEELREQINELNERIGKSSRNSSRPPIAWLPFSTSSGLALFIPAKCCTESVVAAKPVQSSKESIVSLGLFINSYLRGSPF
jgi:hypothetical protein